MKSLKGIVYALASSSTFGLIPPVFHSDSGQRCDGSPLVAFLPFCHCHPGHGPGRSGAAKKLPGIAPPATQNIAAGRILRLDLHGAHPVLPIHPQRSGYHHPLSVSSGRYGDHDDLLRGKTLGHTPARRPAVHRRRCPAQLGGKARFASKACCWY